MQRIFKNQINIAKIYLVMSVVTFVFSLCFMTEYKELFGLKLKQNSQVSFFHDSVLQTYNRQIFVLAIIGIIVLIFSFALEIFTKVPDRFALVVMGIGLLACIAGSVYAFTNIFAIETFYRGLDFQYIHMEGLETYEMKFATFRIGLGIYLTEILVCVGYLAALIMSHVKFVKKGHIEDE